MRNFTQETLNTPPKSLRSEKYFRQNSRVGDYTQKLLALLYTYDKYTEKIGHSPIHNSPPYTDKDFLNSTL